mmetsp:Transcript_94101/g.243577  ORF Transcript_94101/g.243577 Transcript_94101/m.243577 type:complete len:297 (+) Transcript_94101:29-919(+)
MWNKSAEVAAVKNKLAEQRREQNGGSNPCQPEIVPHSTRSARSTIRGNTEGIAQRRACGPALRFGARVHSVGGRSIHLGGLRRCSDVGRLQGDPLRGVIQLDDQAALSHHVCLISERGDDLADLTIELNCTCQALDANGGTINESRLFSGFFRCRCGHRDLDSCCPLSPEYLCVVTPDVSAIGLSQTLLNVEPAVVCEGHASLRLLQVWIHSQEQRLQLLQVVHRIIALRGLLQGVELIDVQNLVTIHVEFREDICDHLLLHLARLLVVGHGVQETLHGILQGTLPTEWVECLRSA